MLSPGIFLRYVMAFAIRRDDEDFLALAPKAGVRTHTRARPLDQANKALADLRDRRSRAPPFRIPATAEPCRHTEPALLVINPHIRLVPRPNLPTLRVELTLIDRQFHILFLHIPLLFSFSFLFSPFAVALTLIANQKQLRRPLQATRPSQFIA